LAVKVESKERVVRITLERPPLNVLDIPLLRELDAVLTSCAQEAETAVVVIEGAGQRAFSAGVDVRDHTRANVPEMLDAVHGVIRKLFLIPQVTIALVRGVCFGGGCELATSCDFIIPRKIVLLRRLKSMLDVIRRSLWRVFRRLSVIIVPRT
jgi:cyclohexa-1,5-dienecarbonyl-CoA hydratase